MSDVHKVGFKDGVRSLVVLDFFLNFFLIDSIIYYQTQSCVTFSYSTNFLGMTVFFPFSRPNPRYRTHCLSITFFFLFHVLRRMLLISIWSHVPSPLPKPTPHKNLRLGAWEQPGITYVIANGTFHNSMDRRFKY